MASLADYYSGAAGAENLDDRMITDLVMQGVPIRYNDTTFASDRVLTDIRNRGGTVMIPREDGRGYSTIRPDANVLPGGDKLISSQEAAARYAQSQAGGRPLDDPYGIAGGAYRQQVANATMQSYKAADYLSQFMPPEQVNAEVARLTGINLGDRLQTTPNLLERRQAEANVDKTRADTTKIRYEARKSEIEARDKQQAYEENPILDRFKVDAAQSALAKIGTRVQGVLDHKGLDFAVGKYGFAADLAKYPGASFLPAVQDGADAREQLNVLKSQVVLETMAALKQSSASGSTGFGALSQGELVVLENSVAALQAAQSPAAIKKALKEVAAFAAEHSGRAEQRYMQQYGKRAVGPGGMPFERGPGREPLAFDVQGKDGSSVTNYIPPAASRAPGNYNTPTGRKYWTGQGWLPGPK